MIASVHNLAQASPIFNSPSSQKFVQSSIELEPPSFLSKEQKSIFEMSRRGSLLSSQYIDQLTQECELKMNEIQELQKGKLDAVKTQAELAQTSSSWQTLQTVASYILSALNVLAGILCIGTAPLAAGICIAIGVLSLANTIFAQLEGYEWIAEKLSNGDKEKEIHLKTVLPLIVSLLLFGANLGSAAFLGIQGGMGVMQLVRNSSSSLVKGLIAAPQFIQGGSHIMQGIYDGKILIKHSEIEALSSKLKEMQASLKLNTESSINDTKMTNRFQQMLAEITDLKMAIEGYSLRLQ